MEDKMKTVKITLVVTLLLMYTCFGANAAEINSTGAAAILMDGASNRVLYGKNIHQRLPIASTTKIMTAIVALEHGCLDETVIIPPEASGIEGSSIWLEAGEEHTLEDLLYGLMLRSGNDAAVAIAIHISGSVEEFAKLMNATAKKIGAYNTNFVNPHGLHDPDHYSTAYDLALIASYGLKNPDFERIVATKFRTIPWKGHEWNRAMRNKNRLLWQYEGANGVKTGYTKKAGRCLVASAKRDNMQLVSVVLNCGPMFEESMELLDYGFKNYKSVKLISHNEIYATIPVKNGKTNTLGLVPAESFSIALREEEIGEFRIEKDLPPQISAPVEKGQDIGKIRVYHNDKPIKEISLRAFGKVEKQGFWDFIRRLFKK